MIGSIIDKYEVLQKLGEGATATVYRGRHTTIGKDVAIKVLHPHLSASSRYRERFNREARAVGRLSHRNIVSILDYSGSKADDCYIVTELVDGVTILDLLETNGRIPSEIAGLIGIELASALAFAHEQGIIHRDIKPENVMIRRDGRVKLMDFGVARVLDEGSITQDGSLLGSPAYMSPQQALDEPLDGRTDIFSLGTVLFHAVTGQVPFSGSNASIILRNIIESNRPEVLELNPAASPALAAVIDRLLQPRVEDRYGGAEEVRAALTTCLDEMRLGVDHPTVNLRAYLVNPTSCEQTLDAHLRTTLLEVGKERLERQDTLGALQLFNRLLAMDEDNAEVIALIQSLHKGPDTKSRPRWIAFAVAAAVLLVSGGLWRMVARHADTGAAHNAPAAAPADNAGVAGAAGGEGVAGPRVDPPVASVGVPTPVAAANAAAPEKPAETGRSYGVKVLKPDPDRVAERAASLASPASGTGATTGSAASSVTAPAQGKLVIQLSGWADVWLDGVMVGSRGRGASATWVATTQSPLLVSPGEHTLELKNDYAEPYKQKITIAEGEELPVAVELRRRPVRVTVNPNLPRDCSVTVDSGGTAMEYGTIAQFGAMFNLPDPDPDTRVTFRCPGRPDPIFEVLGPTAPGSVIIVPKVVRGATP